MMRLACVLVAVGALLGSGCRSIGRFPGIDPTDYAYSYFKGTAAQVFQFNVDQVESSTLQALADFGFTQIERKRIDGVAKIHAKTLDLRHAWISVVPRNAMSNLIVRVGAEGDEAVSQALIQRVGMNLGILPRTIIPIEPTLERRVDPPRQYAPPREPLPEPVRLFDDPVPPTPGPVLPPGPAPTPGPFSPPTPDEPRD
jgi:hypothetical protein